ncbi:RHS repeat-associated core domain-containing protein [Lonsdalea quercina]|nr:RHS repeat-associated core domain-containing protein [Lonsdalea quercina]
MEQTKSATLVSSEEAASKNFSSDKAIPGGCKECACEIFVQYLYDSGKPVPNAPFVVTDSKGTNISGQTDENGYFKIYDMGCNGYELNIQEGSDEFEPEDTVTNNPVLQSNPEYAALAGEYFTLYLLLSKEGLLEYDQEESKRYNEVGINSHVYGGMYFYYEDKYELAYNRFMELKDKINNSSRELKQAINKVHHSLSTEVASHTTETAVLLFCQIILGFVPIVGQAPDVYFIGEWCWAAYKNPENLKDPYFICEGVLDVIGVVPGAGHALKYAGKSVLKAVGKVAGAVADKRAIQLAIREIRHLSDGNIVRWLMDFASKIKSIATEAIALLNKISLAIERILQDAAHSAQSWIVAFAKDSFNSIVRVLKWLIEKFESIVNTIIEKVESFIAKIVTKKPGTALGKGKATKAEKMTAGATKQESRAAETEAENAAKKKGDELCTSESTCAGDPVDVATGYVVDWRTDFQISGLFPLALKRSYRSGGTRISGLLGKLWRSNWDMSLKLENDVVTFTDGEFNQAIFAAPVEGEYSLSLSNPAWRLTRQQGVLVLRHRDGMSYWFEHTRGVQLCLTAIEDSVGNRTSLLWEFGELRWVVLADERLVHVETQHGRIACLTLCDRQRRPLQPLVNYTYDQKGYLVSVRAGEGRSFDYRYSPEGWMLRWSDLSETWVEHTYDSQGRAVRDRASEGYWAGSFDYDDERLTTYYHNGFGGVARYIRDERNNILSHRTPDGGETLFEWEHNQLVAQTDPLGYRTEFERNDWGQITAVTLPDGAIHRYNYDDDAQLLAYTDPLGNVWQYQRNARGQVVEVNDPEGREWLHSYTDQGLLETIIAPNGVLQRYHYNARGLVSRIEVDNAPTVRFFYDGQDRVTERHQESQSGRLVRRWEYEGYREAPSKVIYEDGTETTFGFDKEGNLTSVTDALGQQHQFRYGAFDNLMEATDPLGATVRYHYNTEAEFAGVTNSHGDAWTYSFDECGRLSEEQHYDGRVYRYAYDVAGRLTCRTSPDGSQQNYTHDALGRVTEVQCLTAEGATDSVTTLDYDIAGRLLSASNADACVEYTYNRSGQVISERVNGQEIISDYDASGYRAQVSGLLAPLQQQWQSGRLSALGVGSHQALSFSHTDAGQESLRSNGAGFALSQSWSETGLLERQALVNGGGSEPHHLERRYRYDVLDRLVGIKDAHWGEQDFRLNGNGQVTAERRNGRWRQAKLFGYDSEQNLCEVSDIMALSGVPLSVSQAVSEGQRRYDGAGRIVERGDVRYEYDVCGRLSRKREVRAGFRPKETRYEWDTQDRLRRVSLPDGARWRYGYDAFGRRVSKVREGQVASLQSVSKVQYQWDGDQLVGQVQYYADGTPAREVQWVYEPGSFRPLAQVERKGEETRLHYVVTDLAGTARELCSETGEVHWRGEQGLWNGHREDWLPVGRKRYLGDAANEEVYCELRYQGQIYDAETGLYYNRHRYYDADSGQYISPDPIGLAGGENPYAYVPNTLSWVDPLGLSPSSVLDTALGGQVGDRLQAHHVIPVDIWKKHDSFFNSIGMGGSRDSVGNGIHIPGSQAAYKEGLGKGMAVFHSSKHDNYSNIVSDEISLIKDRYNAKELTAKEARIEVKKLQMDLKRRLWSGDVPKTKCGRVY